MKASIVIRCFECRRFDDRLTATICPGTKAKPCGKPLADKYGRKSYYVNASDESGKRWYVKVSGRGIYHSNSKAASLLLAEIIKAQDNGTFRPRKEFARRTLGDVAIRYRKEILPTRRHIKTLERHLKFWEETLGHVQLNALTSGEITEALESLNVGPGVWNRCKAMLGSMLTQALAWSYEFSNPMAKVKSQKMPKRKKVRYLTEDEKNALFTALEKTKHPYLQDLCILALATGARRSEMVRLYEDDHGLKWSEVDFKEEKVEYLETKNGKNRRLPLKGVALEMMKRRWADRGIGTDSEYVFKPFQSIQWSWEVVLRNSGVKKFTFHNLRSTFASWMALNGTSLLAIQKAGGWSNFNQVLAYADLSPDYLDDVIGKMVEDRLG